MADTNDLPRDAYALLAQANLLRMRGCWQEAVDRCMDAMRLAPGHASVHSLLGDIYDNRGSLDDAIQWYRMALDVNPESPADQMKLARLLDVKSRQNVPPAPSAEPIIVPAPLRSADPERLLRRAAYGAGGVVLAIILLAVGLSRPAVKGKAGEHQISAPPIMLPSVQTPDAPAAVSLPRDPAEQQIVDAVRADATMAGSDTQIVDAQSDPRTARLTLTVVITPPAGGITRALLLSDALRAAQSAARVPSTTSVSAFTVRCLVNGTGGAASLILVADTTRANAVSAPSTLDAVTSAFSNLWWSPSAPAS